MTTSEADPTRARTTYRRRPTPLTHRSPSCLAIGVIALLVGACGSDPEPTSGADASADGATGADGALPSVGDGAARICTVGQSYFCRCKNGTDGTKKCADGASYEPCVADGDGGACN